MSATRHLQKEVRAHLHADPDIFHDLVDHGDSEIRMVPLKVIDKTSRKTDVAIFYFPDIRERLEHILVDLMY